MVHWPISKTLHRVAKFADSYALGIIMAGMGGNGARGIKEVWAAGVSDCSGRGEASCVVFRMPKEVFVQVLPLDKVRLAVIIYVKGF